MSNLKYSMTHACLDRGYEDGAGKQIVDSHTEKAYRHNIDCFCQWLKTEYGINNTNQINKAGGAKNFIQMYEKKLEVEGKSSSTIHTYLAPIAKGLGVHLSEIDKPRRAAIDITRSRGDETVNRQGKHEAGCGRFDRVVDFEKMTGLRRSELGKLKVNCVARDESGYLCVKVERGKGGKPQLQRILDQDRESFVNFINAARDAVRGTGKLMSETKLFSKSEMKNHLDLHCLRAEHARDAYVEYLARCKTAEGEKKLQRELVARWNSCHGDGEKITETKEGFMGSSSKAARFVREFSRNGSYEVRGDNRIRCLKEGRPVAYNRTALLAVSVFELSHWRNNVTVTNYML